MQASISKQFSHVEMAMKPVLGVIGAIVNVYDGPGVIHLQVIIVIIV